MIEEGNSADDGVDEAILAALKSRAEDFEASPEEDEALVAAAVNEYLGAASRSDDEARGGVPWLVVVGIVAAAAALAMFLLPALSGSENQHASNDASQAVHEAEERTTTQQAETLSPASATASQDQDAEDEVEADAVESAPEEATAEVADADADQILPSAGTQADTDLPASKSKPKAVPSEAELLQQARQQRSDKQFKAAARTYEQFLQAYPKSKKVPATLVSLAQLYQGPLSDPARALRHFDRYLQRGGPLAEEAHYGKIRALRSLGRTGKANTEIEAFLSSYPNSAYADALSKK